MMKKLLLIAILFPLFQFAQAQEEIVKWTFPNNLITDTVQNGTNALNLTQAIRAEGTSAISMKNGATTYAAQATNWDNGMDVKNWNIRFKTTGYDHVQISSKQQAGGTNGGPKDFKLQFKIGSTGTWADVPGGTITLANDWTTGVISNLDLPAECQNQAELVNIRWIMTSNIDVKGGNVAATGITKIDDIVVTGMLITSLSDQKETKVLSTFPNPSVSTFSIAMARKTSLIEIYNIKGQLVFKTIPENEIETVDKPFPAGLYFIKAMQNGKVNLIKHIVN
jgi:uncharacterized membrane protein